MITYFFPEPGSVPGIPGLFAGVRVDVEEDGTYVVSPLTTHPHFQPAPVEEEPPAPKSKKQAKAPEDSSQAVAPE